MRRPRLTAHDHQMLREWLEKHRHADEIVCDTESGLPIKAIYKCLTWEAHSSGQVLTRNFFELVREIMEHPE